MAALAMLTLLIAGAPGTASACSIEQPLTLDQALGRDESERFLVPTRGIAAASVYEIAPMASAPSIFIKEGESIRGVARYWGEVPPELERTWHVGGAWVLLGLSGEDDCDFFAHHESVYLVVVERTNGHTSTVWVDVRKTVDGDLVDSEVAKLDAAYGAATEIDRGFSEQLGAHASLWWPRLAVAAFLLAVGGLISWRFRRRRVERAT